MVEAVKHGFPQREIADASYELQGEIDAGRRTVVGVNRYIEGDDGETRILRIDPALETKQVERVKAFKASRDMAAVEMALEAIKLAARRPDAEDNLMPRFVDAARAGCSEGEIVHVLQEVWGGYRETPVF
jgi:methylmalonyl-CoA mutase N-terminal domain/subunit